MSARTAVLSTLRVTLAEIRSRRILWVVTALGTVYVAVFGAGIWLIARELAQTGEAYLAQRGVMAMLLTAGLYVVQFLVLVFAAIVSVDAISGAIETGAIQTVVTKPVRRRDVLLGKLGGHVVAVVLFLAAMVLGLVLVMAAVAGYRPMNLAPAMGLMALEGVVVLALSYLGGAVTGTLANGLMIFMLYSVALVGSWIERIGTFAGNESAQYLGIVASLVMPTEALWQRAAWELLPPVLRETVGLATPITSANPPSGAMVVYAVLYAAAMAALAVHAFQKRDL